MTMRSVFGQPFPYDPSAKRKIGMASFFGLFVFIFLLLFQPFQLDQFPFSRLALVAFVYGLVTFLCVLIVSIGLPLLFPFYYKEDKWTTGKEIFITMIVVIMVGIANYLVSPFLVNTTWKWSDAVWFQGITIAIAILPVSMFILFRQNHLLKRFSNDARLLDTKLQHKHETPTGSQPSVEQNALGNKVVIEGDYQQERVELFVDDIYLISSASNYIKVYHLRNEKLEYLILRSTLKKAEETLRTFPCFFKSHRAYIINLDKVIHVQGNAQGYKVRLHGMEEVLPVSKNMNTEFSDKLLAWRTSIS